MKKLITILLIILSFVVSAQKDSIQIFKDKPIAYPISLISKPTDVSDGLHNSPIYYNDYLELRKEYQQYCDSIVIDTFTEYGSVKLQVTILNGEYKLSPKDTVWSIKKCPEYINDESHWYEGSSLTTSTSTLTWGNNWFNTSGTVSKPSKLETEATITRQKYCQCKYEKASIVGFWNWVNKRYLNQ